MNWPSVVALLVPDKLNSGSNLITVSSTGLFSGLHGFSENSFQPGGAHLKASAVEEHRGGNSNAPNLRPPRPPWFPHGCRSSGIGVQLGESPRRGAVGGPLVRASNSLENRIWLRVMNIMGAPVFLAFHFRRAEKLSRSTGDQFGFDPNYLGFP